MALVGSAVRGVLEWLMMVLIINNILHTHAIVRITKTVDNGGPWGAWGHAEYCPEGSYVYGFDIKVEKKQGGGDDSALNGIKLFCESAKTLKPTGNITSAVQKWGTWRGLLQCRGMFMVALRLRAEKPQGGGVDDTSVNNVAMECQDGKLLYHAGGCPWGSYGSWSTCPSGHAVCGLKTRIEPDLGDGDDSALNSVEIYCCAI